MRSLLLFALLAPGALAVEPADILATFELDPAFQLELVAMEPAVKDPVDMEFDETGRVYVLDMAGYPLGEDPGRIVVLKDAEGDGVWESSTVFADGFAVADSILPYKGGLLVANPPELTFLKDTNGDDVADVEETLLRGFDMGNTQHNFNGLTYGLDNWIYAVSGGNSGSVYWAHARDQRIPLNHGDFRMRPDQELFERIGHSSGGFGMSFDSWGRMFETHNMYHINQLVFPGWYVENFAHLEHNTVENISNHEEGGLGRIYPIGEQVTRVNHPEQSGYFSGACGITYYGGNAFPEGYNGNVFVCDVVVNLVHRDVLEPNGSRHQASRRDEKRDFLASTDRAFRPVNLSVGPDGALYVLDMHRDVIEHPEWIPDEIEKDLDVKAGQAEGRIFRISPKAGLDRVEGKLDRQNVEQLAKNLENPNKWWRDTAQRILLEEKGADAAQAVTALLDNERAEARLHALWVLNELSALKPAALLQALKDSDPGVRENAVLLAEQHLKDEQALLSAVRAMSSDADPRVRLQVALSLGTLEHSEGQAELLDSLVDITEQDLQDQWTRLALLTGLSRQAPAALNAVFANAALHDQEGVDELVDRLAVRAGAMADETGLLALLKASSPDGPAHRFAESLLSGLSEGLNAVPDQQRPKKSEALRAAIEAALQDKVPVQREALKLAKALGISTAEQEQDLFAKAQDVVKDESAGTTERAESLSLLALAPMESRQDLLFDLLDTRHPLALQQAAIDQLGVVGSPAIATRLLDMWNTLSPEVRIGAGNILLRRRENHDILLTALESGRLPIGQMNFDLERRRYLLFRSQDESIKRRAEKLFTDAGVVTRQAALEKMKPALELKGDPNAGHQVYADTCAKCHIIGNEGFNVGPNLTEIFRKSKETLLHDILDPNAAVNAEYIGFNASVESEDGFGEELVSGLIVDQTDEAVTLREAGGKERVFPRKQLHGLSSSGLSLMPEELEAGLTTQQVADLLAYLQQPR